MFSKEIKTEDEYVRHWLTLSKPSCTKCGHIRDGIDEICGSQRFTEALMSDENVCKDCTKAFRYGV